jgi:hypothetical protein
VLDQATGLIVKTTVGTSMATTIERALKDAVIRPTEPLTKAIPKCIVCSPELTAAAIGAVSKLSRLADTALVEGTDMWEAEEIFDGLVGHLEGRDQPVDAPSIADWRTLYGELATFVTTAPWQRWSDEDYFELRIDLDGVSMERTAIVLGSAGIQRGFNVTSDPEALERAAEDQSNPLRHLEQSLIVHLNSPHESGNLFTAKARRHGWRENLRVIPQILTVRESQPADLSSGDARLLTIALRAVTHQDSKRLVEIGAPTTVIGEIVFDDAVIGRYEAERP